MAKNDIIIQTKGIDSEVTLYENRIEYTRKGSTGLLMHGIDGKKIIFIRSITGIQFLKNSFIQFIFQGSQESKKGFMSAMKDENSILFNKKYNEDFEKIIDYINSKID